jgi:hypothetical protein
MTLHLPLHPAPRLSLRAAEHARRQMSRAQALSDSRIMFELRHAALRCPCHTTLPWLLSLCAPFCGFFLRPAASPHSGLHLVDTSTLPSFPHLTSLPRSRSFQHARRQGGGSAARRPGATGTDTTDCLAGLWRPQPCLLMRISRRLLPRSSLPPSVCCFLVVRVSQESSAVLVPRGRSL